MKVISFDSCNGLCSVALSIDGQIVDFKLENEISKQAERLFILIEEILNSNNLNYHDLNSIGLNIGPGSFTGVRISIAAAKGIRLASKLPLIGVSGLQALAYATEINKETVIAMDARRDQIYLQIFNADKSTNSSPLLLNYQQALEMLPKSNFILSGDGAKFIAPYIKTDFVFDQQLQQVDAKLVAQAALHTLKTDPNYNFAEPLYIREADAKIAAK
jgi:tRNA threonylcarbamoyl adenosine modification protein YeaZ